MKSRPGQRTIVFFRRHVETGEPLLADPQVFTFARGTSISLVQRKERELRSKPWLFVPENALTVSTEFSKN